jgi:hypothetical protein
MGDGPIFLKTSVPLSFMITSGTFTFSLIHLAGHHRALSNGAEHHCTLATEKQPSLGLKSSLRHWQQFLNLFFVYSYV